MIAEVALLMVSCVLFIQMGLSEAIQGVLHTKLRIVSCPKCLTMWVCLVFLVWHDYGIIRAVATSFIASYCAQWLALLYDAIALLYNYLYEQVTKTTDTAQEDDSASCATTAHEAAHSDAVS